MKLSITKKDNKFEVLLINNNTIVDEATLDYGSTLGEDLLDVLDIFFKRNKMNRIELSGVILPRDLDKNSTAYKVLVAFRKAIEYSAE